MKFSLHLPLNEVFPKGEFQTAAAAREVIQAVERSGATAGQVTDHPAPSAEWLHNDPTGHDAIDPMTALGFAAAASTRLMLLTNVLILPYRNPFLTAKAAATLQVLSDGRLILGVGLGYQEVEFAALGVPFKSRGALADEAIETIRAAWAGGPVVKKGKFFDAVGNEPRPVPSPQPPIWVAGGSDKAVERAARYGDGWIPFLTVPTQNKNVLASSISSVALLREKIQRVRELRQGMGKTGPFDICVNLLLGTKTLGPADAARLRSDAEELASAGANWIRIIPPAPSRAAYLDNVAWLGEELISPLNP
jgi:probable F420-dependent oxidoreductase